MRHLRMFDEMCNFAAMLSEESLEFIYGNIQADPADLLLRYAGHAMDFDLHEAVVQIECRRRCAGKIPGFLACRSFRFADTLSSEQATHEQVARYHASLVPAGSHVMDMTAGLGIDALTMADYDARVTAVELDARRADALRDNAASLGISLEVLNADSVAYLRSMSGGVDVIFIDPARRDSAGKRTYGLADCTPDVLALMPDLLQRCHRLIIKASPMLDVSCVLAQVSGCSRLHIVSVGGECKELLIEVEHGDAAPVISCVDIDRAGERRVFTVMAGERAGRARLAGEPPRAGMYLYEPSATLMKLGAWGCLCERFEGMGKLDAGTHLFVSRELYPDFPGRILVIEAIPDRRAQKSLRGETFNVCTRNYPLSAPALAARLRVKEGSDTRFLYGCRSLGTPLLLVCRRVD